MYVRQAVAFCFTPFGVVTCGASGHVSEVAMAGTVPKSSNESVPDLTGLLCALKVCTRQPGDDRTGKPAEGYCLGLQRAGARTWCSIESVPAVAVLKEHNVGARWHASSSPSAQA